MNTQTCTHNTRIIESQQAGYSIERCTWECGQALIKLIMDSQFRLVATFTIDQLVEIVKEHAAMGEQIDKMNTEMPCGHLTRYQVQEKATQYCSLCRSKSLEVCNLEVRQQLNRMGILYHQINAHKNSFTNCNHPHCEQSWKLAREEA